MAFAVISAARHPLVPLAGASLTRLQDSRHAAGWTVAPPEGAFDTALRRRAFPPDAGSLLPGLLAATRTGLTPAGGHELARDYLNATTSKGVITSRTHAAGHTKLPLGLGMIRANGAAPDTICVGGRFRTAGYGAVAATGAWACSAASTSGSCSSIHAMTS